MPMKKRKVAQSLQRKGFVRDEEGHHIFFTFHGKILGETTVRTRISHGSSGGDISDNLVKQMADQCRLNKGDFQKLIDCTLSYEEYEEKLRAILSL